MTQGFTSVTLVHQNALSRYVNRMNLTLEETDDDGAHTMLLQSAVLRDTLDGITPELQPRATLPLELQEGEKLVWASENVGHFRTVNVKEPNAAIHSHNVQLIQAPGWAGAGRLRMPEAHREVLGPPGPPRPTVMLPQEY